MSNSDESQHVGRNAPCPCGSGRKYKHCCLNRDQKQSGFFIFRWISRLYRFYLRLVDSFINLGDTNRTHGSTRLIFLGGWPNEFAAALFTFMTVVILFSFFCVLIVGLLTAF